MTLVELLFAVSLLHLFEVKGSSDVLFVQEGKDVLLDVKSPVQLNRKTDFFWKFNSTYNVGKVVHEAKEPVLHDMYEGRAEISVHNYSLLLKNLQTTDSGDYTAVVSGSKDETVAEYKLIIQEPVSDVDLRVKPYTSDTCNLTVTCGSKGSGVNKTFRCENQSCSEEGGGAAYSVSVRVHVDEGFIFCNVSNNVSWREEKKNIESYCQPRPGPVLNEATKIVIGTTTAAAVALIALFICLFIKCRRKKCEKTIYEVPQNVDRGPALDQHPTEDASGVSPSSTYALVQFHTGPGKATKTKDINRPETVYAQVRRKAKPTPAPATPTAEKHWETPQ